MRFRQMPSNKSFKPNSNRYAITVGLILVLGLMNSRKEILEKLARFDEPSAPLIEALRAMGWDWSEEPLLVLTAEHFLSVMDRFLSGQLSAEQIEQWAENLEHRDDVGFAPPREELLDEILFCLANPSINRAITHESVGQFKQQLLEA